MARTVTRRRVPKTLEQASLMETIEAEDLPQIEIRDTKHIAEVIEALSYHTHALSIRSGDTSTAYPVTLRRVDDKARTLSLSLLDAQSLDAAGLVNQSLTLLAEEDTEALRFEQLIALEVLRQKDVLKITCSLPETMHTTSKRNSRRITLLDGMQVPVSISLYENAAPITGRLNNLSIGGALLEVALGDSAPLRVNEFIAQLAIAFPNAENFTTMAHILHVNPAGRSRFAAIGVSFINTNRADVQRLTYLANETEREVAYRNGEGGRMSFPSPLYSSSEPGYKRTGRARRHTECSPLVNALLEVARQLHIFLLALQNHRPLPAKCVLKAADILLRLLEVNRQHLFYALHCLNDEPAWIQHSLNVSVRLGDLVLSEPEHAHRAREAVVAALLHDMGKMMLINDHLPSIDGQLDARQRQHLRSHVAELLKPLEGAAWLTPFMRHEVIECINERMDGSGYPGDSGQRPFLRSPAWLP
ncbi:hypothetical protein B9G99_08845 [Kushneria konosiri]|uniref:PilZ domain-containing protein n=1 Tax=Kushneria konosiri TaxID=698828 RepID=A0A2Z2H6R5_9GAMM|nr:hypothetical protein B9G99_08845 [Kushneria konosiri]